MSLAIDRRNLPATPTTIEGVDSRKYLKLDGYVQDQTFIGMSGHIEILRVLMLKHQRTAMLVNSGLLLICAFLGLFITLKGSKFTSQYLLTAWIFLLPFDLETFGPQRYPYSNVLLVLPAAMLMFAALQRRAQPNNRLLLGFAALATISALLSRTPYGPVALITTVGFFTVVLALSGVCIFGIFSASRMLKTEATLQSKVASH